MRAVGIDSCRAGWVVAAIDESGKVTGGLYPDVSSVCGAFGDAASVLIDIPIGLPRDRPRDCDIEARRLLAPRRSSSVFPVPCRGAVYAPDYRSACELNRRLIGKAITKQTWNICPKIREVDTYLRTRSASVPPLRESHPELCFWSLADRTPMRHSKRTDEGYAERLALLVERTPSAPELVRRLLARHRRAELARDDVVDALVLAVSALTPPERLDSVPQTAVYDGEGMTQEIVFPPSGGV